MSGKTYTNENNLRASGSGPQRVVYRRVETALATAVVLSLVVLGVILVDQFGRATAGSSPSSMATAHATQTAGAPVHPAVDAKVDPTQVTELAIAYPTSGPGNFLYAGSTGAVLGTAGPIRRFHVAIESNITAVDMAAFVAKIDATLGDPRSWIASRAYRLQQVPRATPAQFTIYLATPATTQRMCAPLNVHDYTSCRQGAAVMLNLARYLTSVPEYRAGGVVLDTYRSYMINHEVGHALGHGHELCPGPGLPAPVMEQQTLGLHGCVANPWPYLSGRRYSGPPGQY